jgi:hypothetical protein
MEHNLVGYARYYHVETHKSPKVVLSQEKMITLKEKFQNINEQSWKQVIL